MTDVLPPYARVQQHAERARPDEVPAILAEGLVAHVGIVHEGRPVVIPMTYHYDLDAPDVVYLHGGHDSRLLQHVAGGAPVSIGVTLVDGLVLSKSALMHSVNYRSVVAFGEALPAPDAETARALMHRFIARYVEGRAAGTDYLPIPDPHIAATAFVPVRLSAANAKVRRGGPKGPGDADPAVPGTAGVVHLEVTRRTELLGGAAGTTDAAANPQGYVAAVLAVLGARDPAAVLAELVGEVRGVVAAHPRERLERPEAPGKWSVLQVVQHLADMEIVFGFRMRQILTLPRPSLPAIDETAWMARVRRDDRDPGAALAQLEVLRREHLRLWATVTPEELARVGVHEQRGPETLAHWQQLMAGHDLVHRRQIARILAALG